MINKFWKRGRLTLSKYGIAWDGTMWGKYRGGTFEIYLGKFLIAFCFMKEEKTEPVTAEDNLI